jgi:hypothetical protein
MTPDSSFNPTRCGLALALVSAAVLTACGGGGDSTSNTVPGAPTIGAATAGNTSASIAFTAPSSNGGASITGYTATCSAGTASKTGTGTASPVTVSSLSNGTAYSCTVTATNSVGTSAASASVSVTPTAGSSGSSGTSTAGVQCSYSYSALNANSLVNLTSTANWSCSSTTRTLSANSVPDHDVGPFTIEAALDFKISAQTTSVSATLTPTVTSTTGSQVQPSGYALNGLKFDPGTGGNCKSTATSNDTTLVSGSTTETTGGCTLLGNLGTWRMEALGQSSFNFGTDVSNGHVQPTGEYHYHGMPEKFITKLGKGTATMTLVGWASDGFPMYARYGYVSATDATSGVKALTSSWRKKSTPDSGRPSTSIFPMGTFLQDYEYAAGTGDLDECNGRTGVTPEFPGGIYHYVVTDSWPYVHRCVKGTATGGGGGGMPPPPPGG